MDIIGFPKNLPNEFKSYFIAYHNETVRLKEEVNSLRRIIFGRKSEKYYTTEVIDPKGSLFNEVETLDKKNENPQEEPKTEEPSNNPNPNSKPKPKKQNGGRKPFPENLPGVMVEPSVISYIAVNKFYFALPLYRQEAAFKQMGLEISRMTMARWMIAAADAILPLVDEIQNYILSNKVVHCDETSIQVLHGTGKEPTAKTYMWVLASGMACFPAVVFKYYNSRSGKCAYELLKSFKGFLQVDGYDGYNSVANSLQIIRVGCWAHVRRKFDTAYKDGAQSGKALASQFLEKIKLLFLIERENYSLEPEKRVEIRQEKSKPIIDKIRDLIDNNVTKIFPKSKIGTAFGYITNEWPYLLHFLNHGDIALSNNRAENTIRPFVVGRKNWLFANTINGANASAALYSLVVSAKENQLPIDVYLTDVLTQLPNIPPDPSQRKAFLEKLLPWNWEKPDNKT